MRNWIYLLPATGCAGVATSGPAQNLRGLAPPLQQAAKDKARQHAATDIHSNIVVTATRRFVSSITHIRRDLALALSTCLPA